MPTQTRQIPFNDFKAEYQSIRNEVNDAVGRVLESGWYVLGKELEAFEQAFADHGGLTHAIGVANGTDAIALALMAVGVKSGDEVITTAVTAFPTVTAIQQIGAIPVAVDINPETGLIDPAAIEPAISESTTAIVPVHLYGQACDMPAIMRLANTHGLKVVEDCAQAVSATWAGQTVGTFGHASAFSFYPTKNLGAYGDAGLIDTQDKAIALRCHQLRNYGQSKRYHHPETGKNSRLDELQAAILRCKLPKLNDWTKRRQQIAARYSEALPDTCLLQSANQAGHVYHLFVIKNDNPEQLISRLNEKGVQALIHYPIPVNAQGGYHGRKVETPNANAFCQSILSLPIHPWLEPNDVDQVINAINEDLS